MRLKNKRVQPIWNQEYEVSKTLHIQVLGHGVQDYGLPYYNL